MSIVMNVFEGVVYYNFHTVGELKEALNEVPDSYTIEDAFGNTMRLLSVHHGSESVTIEHS